MGECGCARPGPHRSWGLCRAARTWTAGTPPPPWRAALHASSCRRRSSAQPLSALPPAESEPASPAGWVAAGSEQVDMVTSRVMLLLVGIACCYALYGVLVSGSIATSSREARWWRRSSSSRRTSAACCSRAQHPGCVAHHTLTLAFAATASTVLTALKAFSRQEVMAATCSARCSEVPAVWLACHATCMRCWALRAGPAMHCSARARDVLTSPPILEPASATGVKNSARKAS